MSRHLTWTSREGQPVLVVAGYDRPLRELFLHVIHQAAEASPACSDEVFVYNSLSEPEKDWQDIRTIGDTLEQLNIRVPQSLLEQIYLDQCLNVGNRCMEHVTVDVGQARPR
ncbi:hypothetical protein [Roseateles flavus]|uniref:Uncharacterized protein n=1 Tax=Roseateles flavus TaxID=3149041 RepID=A0ABV0GGF0_9BURK